MMKTLTKVYLFSYTNLNTEHFEAGNINRKKWVFCKDKIPNSAGKHHNIRSICL